MKQLSAFFRVARFFFVSVNLRIVTSFLFVFFLISKGAGSAFAQDVHFSQCSMTPLLINPALTGMYGGEHRAFLNYKNQWSGMAVQGAAYRTAAFSYDTRLLTKKFKSGYLGAGINAFKDVAGDLNLGTTQVNVSVAGIVYINDKQLLSGGLQGGFVQKSISTSAMQWDSQYDQSTGAFNSSLPSNDVTSIPPARYGDFSAGLAWNYGAKQLYMHANNQLKMNFGIAAFHINSPSQKLNPYITNSIDNLDRKFIVHGSAQIGIASTDYEFVPSVLAFKQGTSYEVDLGTMVRWTIKGVSKYTGYVHGMALSVGALYRMKDALIPMAMFEYSDYAIGLSYDVNTSSLNQATRGKGGIEISLRYIKPVGVSSTRLLD